jgi:hypothetical protein
MHGGTLLTVGAPWPANEFELPADGLSFGWHLSHLLVIGDPFSEIDIETYRSSAIRVGIAEFGPLGIVAIEAGGIPAPLDCARPYLLGDAVPEVGIEEGDHVVWQMAIVQAGVVANIRAFTTSPETTVVLRRIAAGQRAAGPMSMSEADEWIHRWYQETPSATEVWQSCSVICQSGD